MGTKRLKKSKQRSMRKRLVGGKKPMNLEQKEIRKKMKETQKKEILDSQNK